MTAYRRNSLLAFLYKMRSIVLETKVIRSHCHCSLTHGISCLIVLRWLASVAVLLEILKDVAETTE